MEDRISTHQDLQSGCGERQQGNFKQQHITLSSMGGAAQKMALGHGSHGHKIPKLVSSSCHPRIVFLRASQKSLEREGPTIQEPAPLPFLPELGSTRRNAYNCPAVCLVKGRTHTPWGKEVIVNLRGNISEARSPEL